MFGIIIAFKNYKLSAGHGFIYSLFHSEWCGFDNFKFFIQSNAFTMLLRNTILYNIVFIILGLVIPVTLAIIISQIYSKFKSKVYQTLMFFPHFMSWVVASYFVFAFLSPDKGILNQIITHFGGQNIQWYSNPKYWPLILVVMNLWKTVGYSMVVYLASITGIDGSLYEAAVIDGATKFQQARYITIPSIKPIVIMMFILNVGKSSTPILVCSIRWHRASRTRFIKLLPHLILIFTMHCRQMLRLERQQQPDSSSRSHAALRFYLQTILSQRLTATARSFKRCWYDKTKRRS